MDNSGWRKTTGEVLPPADEARLLTEIAEIRSKIDGLDDIISRLLAERLGLAQQLTGAKGKLALPVQDAGREVEVLKRVSAAAGDPALAEAVKRIYEAVMAESRALQCQKNVRLSDKLAEPAGRDHPRSPELGRRAPLYFPRICVAGLGLIGGALARQVRRRLPRTAIVGVDEPEVLAEALRQGVIDTGQTEVTTALHKAQLVILAATPDENLKLLEKIAPHLSRRQLVLDVTSTKQAICKLAGELDLRGADFIGGHPFFGSEKSGLAGSQDLEIEGRTFCLVPAGRSSEMSLRRVSRWLSALGFNIDVCDATTHDAAVAGLSHAVQLLAVLLGAEIAEGLSDCHLKRRLRLSGPSFAQLARLMESPPELWTEIIMQNREAVAAILRSLAGRIDLAADSIRSGDAQAIRDEFLSASRVPKNM